MAGTEFQSKILGATPDSVAPDGSMVRKLLRLKAGSLAHFELAPGKTSIAVTHRTIEEIWFFLSGKGQMWRKLDEQEEVIEVQANVCLTIPLGTRFQFRSFGPEPLAAIGSQSPPWPGDGEAVVVEGIWPPSL